MAGPQTRARVPARRGARRAAAGVAIAALFALSGCGEKPIPPLPSEFASLDDQEAGCATCHDGRSAPPLSPGATATPSMHPMLSSLQRIIDGMDLNELR